jgi:transcriptional regulator with XRE-family HTH domain
LVVDTQKKPPFLRRRLGRRLRALREEAGLSLEEAAARLDKTRSALNRIETGTTRADVHFVRSAMDVYDAYVEDLLDQTRAALKPEWFRSYGVDDLGYLDVETHACAVREFTGLNLPGLLQTEGYVRAMLSTDKRSNPDRVANDVRVRLIRQERLACEADSLGFFAIVDEGALLRNVGGPVVMREQLRKLIQMAALPNVDIQVLPLRGGAHSAMNGGFTLLTFPAREDPELLYVEYATGALHIEDEEEVQVARMKFEALRFEAMSSADSLAHIEHIIDERFASR